MYKPVIFKKNKIGVISLLLSAFLTSCSSQLPQVKIEMPASNTDLTLPPATSISTVRPTTTLVPTPKPLPTPTPIPTRNVDGAFPLISNTALKADVALRHRPNGAALSPTISRGQSVALLGKAQGDKGQWWYRVIWANNQKDFIGWIAADSTNFPQDKLADLRPPPVCARYLGITQNFDGWQNTKEQAIVVLADLYRLNPQGDFPVSTLLITIDGQEQTKSSRPIVSTRGQFLLGRGTAVNIGTIKATSKIGFLLKTPSKENITLFATIFAVPDGCEFENNN